MNKGKWSKIFLTIIVIIITIVIGSLIYLWFIKDKLVDKESDLVDTATPDIAVVSYEGTFQTKGIVVRQEKDSLIVMPIPGDETNRNQESFQYERENDLNLKQGQEVIVTFHYLENNVHSAIIEKVEIVKEKSDIELPRDIIVKAYSSKKKIEVNIDKQKSNNSKITFVITDNNEFKYDYAIMKYDIRKYNAPPTKTEVIYENNTTSIAGYDPWPEITKIKDTSTTANYTITENGKLNVEIDWTNIYGKLEEGKYKLGFSTVSEPRKSIFNEHVIDYPYDNVIIYLHFEVNAKGQVEYNEIEVL